MENDFAILSADIDCQYTTLLKASALKSKKVKLLFGELSTVKRTQRNMPSLYLGWYCVLCGTDKEDFNHI